MRAFVVFCLVATACADKLGYNYKPVGHSDFGLSFAPGGSSGHVSGGFDGVSHGVGGGFTTGGSFGQALGGSQGGSHGFGGSVSGGSGFGGPAGSFGVGGSNGGFNGSPGTGNAGLVGSGPGNFNGGVSYAPQAELEKEFYTFTANEDDFSTPQVENQVLSSAKKGLRVIFIKGPESNGLEKSAIALAKHIAEQKTAIYVLQKQADLSNLSNQLNTINSNVNHKPEVHFVKYRTHEDAINAQKAIQGQYDSLGGISNNYNGGEAPVLNFASKAPVAPHGSHGSFGPSGSVGSSGPVGSSGSLASFGSSGSLGSSGTIGSSGTFESSGSLGSSGVSDPSSSYIPPSAPSSTYLPA